MTNFEHYKEQIEKITRLGLTFGINNNTGKVDGCSHITCTACKFFGGCSNKKLKWADEEYIEPVNDWSNIPIDTKVLVSDNGEFWYNYYFAGVDKEGRPRVWHDGATSWSIRGLPKRNTYKYTKLVEE